MESTIQKLGICPTPLVKGSQLPPRLAKPPKPLALTRAERHVLLGIMEGLTSRQIASDLGCSKRTVDFHIANIYGKLGISNRVAALMIALRHGLVSQEDHYLPNVWRQEQQESKRRPS